MRVTMSFNVELTASEIEDARKNPQNYLHIFDEMEAGLQGALENIKQTREFIS